jgi:hypothetical protein
MSEESELVWIKTADGGFAYNTDCERDPDEDLPEYTDEELAAEREKVYKRYPDKRPS